MNNQQHTKNNMGYTTEFEGSFYLDKPLSDEHRQYLLRFVETRRISRRSILAEAMPDPLRLAVGLPIGEQGAYFVGGKGIAGQDTDASIIDFNEPPRGQPGLWCQWIPNEDGTEIGWDGGEKFYYYEAWLQYIIAHFLQPWGYLLSGCVTWQGEDPSDAGRITVTDNKLEVEFSYAGYGADAAIERDAYRKELSAVMPEDYKDWWQNSKAEWPAVAAATIRDLRARNLTPSAMLAALVEVDDARRVMLETLWAGSAKVGRWLNASGECEPDTADAIWTPYTPKEQAEWLRDNVVPRLERLVFAHDTDGNPVISSEILRKHEFDKEPETATRYPQAHAD